MDEHGRDLSDYIRPLILMGYSKGAPDLLDFVVSYPAMAQRVVAVISLAGAVSGSPLASESTQDQAERLAKVPRSGRAPGQLKSTIGGFRTQLAGTDLKQYQSKSSPAISRPLTESEINSGDA